MFADRHIILIKQNLYKYYDLDGGRILYGECIILLRLPSRFSHTPFYKSISYFLGNMIVTASVFIFFPKATLGLKVFSYVSLSFII